MLKILAKGSVAEDSLSAESYQGWSILWTKIKAGEVNHSYRLFVD